MALRTATIRGAPVGVLGHELDLAAASVPRGRWAAYLEGVAKLDPRFLAMMRFVAHVGPARKGGWLGRTLERGLPLGRVHAFTPRPDRLASDENRDTIQLVLTARGPRIAERSVAPARPVDGEPCDVATTRFREVTENDLLALRMDPRHLEAAVGNEYLQLPQRLGDFTRGSAGALVSEGLTYLPHP